MNMNLEKKKKTYQVENDKTYFSSVSFCATILPNLQFTIFICLVSLPHDSRGEHINDPKIS